MDFRILYLFALRMGLLPHSKKRLSFSVPCYTAAGDATVPFAVFVFQIHQRPAELLPAGVCFQLL